jgi:DMSO/TMAO reductase YedYZ molybdopterin-dependent catalytic subunit
MRGAWDGRIAWLAVLTSIAVLPGLAAAQSGRAEPLVVLKVDGLVETPLSLSAEDLQRLPRLTVEATDHGGAHARFEGVSLTEILKAAGAPLGDKLRGPQLSKFLLVSAADGYRAVFALPELDPGFTSTIVLLADRRDGKLLSAEEGPLRLVVAHEKRQGRWVRQVQALTVLQAGSPNEVRP